MITNKALFFLIFTACLYVAPITAQQSPDKTIGTTQEAAEQEEHQSGVVRAADRKSLEQEKLKRITAQAIAAVENQAQKQADEILAVGVTILAQQK